MSGSAGREEHNLNESWSFLKGCLGDLLCFLCRAWEGRNEGTSVVFITERVDKGRCSWVRNQCTVEVIS